MSSLGEEILRLVQVPSETGSEGVLADLLQDRLCRGRAGSDHDVRRVGDSLVVIPRGARLTHRSNAPGRQPWLVLAGHIDTVPRGGAPEPALEGGRIRGRGSADMKAGIAVMLRLLESMPATDGFASRVFVFYAGEEGAAATNQLGLILGEEPWLSGADLAILMEPTGGALELGCQGSIHVEVVFRGKPCHSARPWLGQSAIEMALPWLRQCATHPVRDVEIAGCLYREVLTVTKLHAGEARNVVPGELRANMNLRYAPDRSREEAERLALSLGPTGAEVELTVVDHAPAGRIDSSAPLFADLLQRVPLPRRGKQAWTDVGRFSEIGVPALNWGPGDPTLAHTSAEAVEVAEAERCLDLIREFLLGPMMGSSGKVG